MASDLTTLLSTADAGKQALEALTTRYFSEAWRAVNEGQLDVAPALIKTAAERFSQETGRRATAFLIPLEAELHRQRMLAKLREDPRASTTVRLQSAQAELTAVRQQGAHWEELCTNWRARAQQAQQISDLLYPFGHVPLDRLHILFRAPDGTPVVLPGTQTRTGSVPACLALDHVLAGRVPLDARVERVLVPA